MNIEIAVDKLVKKFKTRNPFEIAELMNINIIETPLPESIRGIYQYHKKNKFIYLNNSLEYYKKKYTCSHELGHAFWHPKFNTYFLKKNTFFVGNKFEIEADKFAAELLIDKEVLEVAIEKGICSASKEFGIPIEFFQYKLGHNFF